jgi:hypothetical protein
MAFWKKQKKLQFWKKREERGKKGQRSKEDVEAVLLKYIINLNRIRAGSEARITELEASEGHSPWPNIGTGEEGRR